MPAPLLSLLAGAALAATPAPDTTHYVVVNHGRPAGEMLVVRDGDSVAVRYGHVDRNRGRWLENRYRVANGEIVGAVSRTLDRHWRGDAVAERFDAFGDSARWVLGTGNPTAARREPGAIYRMRNATGWDLAVVANHLLARPERRGTVLGAGAARAVLVADTTVSTASGPRRVRYVMVHQGSSSTPSGVWLDEQGELFATDAGWFVTVRRGGEGALPLLRAVERRWREAQAAAMAQRLAPPAARALVIRNGDLFDSERGVVRPRQTVVVQGDRITAVGPADSVRVPAGATVIDATGKTIVPGLWDNHVHLQLTSQTGGALQMLAAGLTTVRDLAADTDVAVSHRDRADAGAIVSPRVILAGFIEGPGAWAGPSDVIVRTEEEARAAVARYDSLGYRQIKLYNLVHPDLVPTIAEEAHRRSLRLSGHVPRGLSVPAAIHLGFDEINHAAFIFSTFFQDSLYTPEMRPYSGVAAVVAPNVDVQGPEMTALIELLKRRSTVLDGTFNLWMGPETGSDTAAVRRAKAANANYLALIERLYDAGVTLVPGTDNTVGSTYHTELELHERAGIPAPAVLQMATIGSARVMKEDADYGSIVPGKVADIVIVDGRPAERVADLRKVHRVIRAGRVYDPQALRAAVMGQGGSR